MSVAFERRVHLADERVKSVPKHLKMPDKSHRFQAGVFIAAGRFGDGKIEERLRDRLVRHVRSLEAFHGHINRSVCELPVGARPEITECLVVVTTHDISVSDCVPEMQISGSGGAS